MPRLQRGYLQERETLMRKRNAQYVGIVGYLRALREKPAIPYELIAEAIMHAFPQGEMASILVELNNLFKGKYGEPS